MCYTKDGERLGKKTKSGNEEKKEVVVKMRENVRVDCERSQGDRKVVKAVLTGRKHGVREGARRRCVQKAAEVDMKVRKTYEGE